MSETKKTAFELSWGDSVPTCATCPLFAPEKTLYGKCARDPSHIYVQPGHFCGTHPMHAANLLRVTGKVATYMRDQEAVNESKIIRAQGPMQ